MIFYRLSDEQAGRAIQSIMLAVPVTAFLAFQIASQGRFDLAVGFGVLMAMLLALIGVQIRQSRRLNAAEREIDFG